MGDFSLIQISFKWHLLRDCYLSAYMSASSLCGKLVRSVNNGLYSFLYHPLQLVMKKKRSPLKKGRSGSRYFKVSDSKIKSHRLILLQPKCQRRLMFAARHNIKFQKWNKLLIIIFNMKSSLIFFSLFPFLCLLRPSENHEQLKTKELLVCIGLRNKKWIHCNYNKKMFYLDD